MSLRRSMLFFPGNNPNMLGNSDILGADTAIFDLEDAVSPDEKDAARILVRCALEAMTFKNCEVAVRINAVDTTGYWKQDLMEIVPMRPDVIIPPKVNTTDYIEELSAFLTEIEQRHGIPDGSTKLIPLIETAEGLENVSAIAKCSSRIIALFLGAEDLTADLRCVRTKESEEIFYARSKIVSAARAAGIDVYDTPYTDIQDDEGLAADASYAKSLGFTGKVAISPRHVGVINQVFSPTPEEIEYAYEVLEAIETAKALGKGAIALYGKMIDAPIVLRAKQVLATKQAIQEGRRA